MKKQSTASKLAAKMVQVVSDFDTDALKAQLMTTGLEVTFNVGVHFHKLVDVVAGGDTTWSRDPNSAGRWHFIFTDGSSVWCADNGVVWGVRTDKQSAR